VKGKKGIYTLLASPLHDGKGGCTLTEAEYMYTMVVTKEEEEEEEEEKEQ
jgi:hypothetical protein